MPVETVSVPCCIVGGGPAGMMAGFLLARAGVQVLVLEKHADFLRDFRGDTIHPSTLEVMHELGLLPEFLRLPHQEVAELSVSLGGEVWPVADFRRLPTRCRFVAFMPQWDFLDFLAGQGSTLPGFGLRLRAEVTGLIEERGRVAGVRAATADGPLEVRCGLVLGADGRQSAVRAAAGLVPEDLGAPMDVLWFRLPRRPGGPAESMGYAGRSRILVLIDRGEHWQCGFVIAKGSLEGLRARGLEAFRAEIAGLAPVLANVVGEIAGWDEVKLLTVQVNRLRRWWRPGLLCIGDAAHAMSPVGGVGVNLAVQDAVATANLLAGPLRAGRLTTADLERVQRRRALPARATQRLQLLAQDRIVSRVLGAEAELKVPALLRLAKHLPWLRRLPARLIGMGVRPEHVTMASAYKGTP